MGRFYQNMEEASMQLKTSCILNIPFQTYINDFSFFVNGEEFKTSRIVSDILSPKICKIHLNDPTFSEFTINTQHQGHFSHILNLIKFNQSNFPEEELLFIIEVIDILGNDSIEFNFPKSSTEITLENVFSLIQKYRKLSFRRIEKEIEFVASHFSELCNKHKDEFASLDDDLLIKIISNDHFQISDEDEFLNFVNYLYQTDSKYSILYEYVNFLNLTKSSLSEFLEIFDMNDLTCEIWSKICKLIIDGIQKPKEVNCIQIPFDENNEFSGIFKYIREEINSKIENEINITCSSCQDINSDRDYNPRNILYFDENKAFWSDSSSPNNWICFDFKEHRVKPTDYTMKTYGISPNRHPKCWVIEGSNDNENWVTLDVQKDCLYTKSSKAVHTFKMNQNNEEAFQYIRFRATSEDWSGMNFVIIDSLELFGFLFKLIN